MVARGIFSRWREWGIAALLAIVLGYALAPSPDSDFRPRHGSAFSASTVDVALASFRKPSAELRAQAFEPTQPGPIAPVLAVQPSVADRPAQRYATPPSTGPPSRDRRRRPPTRAPPA